MNPRHLPLPIDQQQKLGLAIQYHQGGRLTEAEELYRRILAIHPGYPEILHRLGALLMQAGRPDEALPLLEQAKRSDPGNAGHWLLLTQCLLDLDRPKDAGEVINEAIRMGLRHPKADELLAQASSARGKSEWQSTLKQELVKLERLLSIGEFGRAEIQTQAFVQRHQKNAHAWHILAMARMAQAKNQAAIEPLQHALRLEPGRPELHFKLGHCFEKHGLIDKAIGAYQMAFDIKPDFIAAQDALIDLLMKHGHYEDGLKVCNRILKSQPSYFPALNNKALILQKCGCSLEAIEVYRQAMSQGGGFAEFRTNYGHALKEMMLFDEALHQYHRALEINPDYLEARSNVIFVSNYLEGTRPEALLKDARAYGEALARKAVPYVSHFNIPDPDRRLRIGLVSGDLGEHPVGYFLESVLKSLDTEKLELFAYSTVNHPEGGLNQRLRSYVPHWREATQSTMSDEALAKKIREDQIDILVDLSGHTGHNRLPVFAWKPAPVQVTWLGYFGTTGVTAIDYILGDPWVLPVEEEGHFVEHPWRLPDSYYCFTPPKNEIDVMPLPAQANGCITFGCFNALQKINNRVISCWAQILQRVPGSILFMKNKLLGDDALAKDYQARFAAFGISSDRLIMEGFSPRADYLSAYNRIDITLDPFPYPGGTTSVESLWMGVPVLTIKGHRFLSHQGETIMQNVGLPDWIAENEDDYVAKGTAFACDLEKVAELRGRLRQQVLASPLFDAPRFARNLEDAFRGMWRRWCEGIDNKSS